MPGAAAHRVVKPDGSREVRIAVTLGDPGGIGPEVTAKALGLVEPGTDATRVIGPVERGEDFAGLGRFEAVEGGAAGLHPGRAAGLAVERAVELALAGEVDAVVTAPVHKPGLAAAGYCAGHTEMLMELTGATDVGMLMCDEGGDSDSAPKRVLLATIHIPLSEVPESLNEARLVSQTRLLGAALRSDWGLATSRIALCALNPHASDNGLFGTEERDVYEPALAALADDRWRVTGPVPADTVFVRAFSGEFDAVVAPYHDVGMAAFKTAAFGRGVNVTIGLPFVRTSPDHGTAFDIAGRGVADPSSMVEAVRLAMRLARARKTGRRTAPMRPPPRRDGSPA